MTEPIKCFQCGDNGFVKVGLDRFAECLCRKPNQCGCLCHSTGMKYIKTSLFSQLCCSCNPFNLTPFIDKIEPLKQEENINKHPKDKVCHHNVIRNHEFSAFCIKCIIERIEKLEKEKFNLLRELQDQLNATEKDCQDLYERIEKLEFHKNMQIDENRKSFRYIEELEERIKRIEIMFSSIFLE